jgi:hypothetical protein
MTVKRENTPFIHLCGLHIAGQPAARSLENASLQRQNVENDSLSRLMGNERPEIFEEELLVGSIPEQNV